MTLSKKEKEAQAIILNEIKKSHDLLQSFCKDYCKDNQTKAVPLAVIIEAQKIIFKNLEKGMTENE